MKQLPALAVTALLVAAAAGAGVLLGLREAPRGAPAALQWLQAPRPLPDFVLHSAQGDIDRNSLLGHWTLLTFGYTHCPDVCPVTLATLARSLALRADPAASISALFVSVDPQRDTPQLLHDYAGYFGPHLQAASGDDEQLRRLANAVGVRFSAAPTDANDYLLAHSTLVLLIGPQAQLRARIATPVAAAVLAAELNHLEQPPQRGS